MDLVEVYFSNLTADKQKEVLEFYEVESPEEMNWDVMPIFIIERG